MKILKKTIFQNGRVHVYFMGIKIASYKKSTSKQVEGTGNILNISKTHKCNIEVHGNNNTVVIKDIPSNLFLNKYDVYIYGNNNRVIIEECSLDDISNLIIYVGFKGSECNNCDIHIGKGTSFGQTSIVVCDNNTVVEIGDDCMFSFLEQIWASDTHTIINDKQEIINIGHHVKIGNHVWVGADVSILKNTTIGDNCILGTKSVVGGNFTKPGCVIAGNPARVVKENVNWSRQRPNEYIAGGKK